jgi:hypothetical protein
MPAEVITAINGGGPKLQIVPPAHAGRFEIYNGEDGIPHILSIICADYDEASGLYIFPLPDRYETADDIGETEILEECVDREPDIQLQPEGGMHVHALNREGDVLSIDVTHHYNMGPN